MNWIPLPRRLPNPQVTLYGLDGGPLSIFTVQPEFWLADDTFETFYKWWGNGEPVRRSLLRGAGRPTACIRETANPCLGVGTRFSPSGKSLWWPTSASRSATTPPPVKVARISVRGGDREYGPPQPPGTDFIAPHQYQEFALLYLSSHRSGPVPDFSVLAQWQCRPVCGRGLHLHRAATRDLPDDLDSAGGNYQGRESGSGTLTAPAFQASPKQFQ